MLYIQLHSSFAKRWGSSLSPNCLGLGKPTLGAEPRIELEPALQQADMLPTELRRTPQKNYVVLLWP